MTAADPADFDPSLLGLGNPALIGPHIADPARVAQPGQKRDTITAPLAIVSLLHEPADVNSATRTLAGEPVLTWTLKRLSRSERLGGVAVVCWEDQRNDVTLACGDMATVLPHGQRQRVPMIEHVAASQRWCDGWRGGLGLTCPPDNGTMPGTYTAVARATGADALLLLPAGFGHVDPRQLDALIDHANERPTQDVYYTQLPPGLSPMLVRPLLLAAMAEAKLHAGWLCNHRPDVVGLDFNANDACLKQPTSLAWSLADLRLNSRRSIERAERWMQQIDLLDADAQALVNLAADGEDFAIPREITLELTTRRHAKPIWLPDTAETDLNVDAILPRLAEAAAMADDLRLNLVGRGDPLCDPRLPAVLRAAQAAGVRAIHVETDLLELSDDALLAMVETCDVVSVHLPAVSREIYTAMMGVDRFGDAISNLARLLSAKRAAGSMTPIIAPIFVKCRANFVEMEAWYDRWLAMLHAAVIRGPGADAPEGVAMVQMPQTARRPQEIVYRAVGGAWMDDERLGEADQPVSDLWKHPKRLVRSAA